jgi:hypothetical protein
MRINADNVVCHLSPVKGFFELGVELTLIKTIDRRNGLSLSHWEMCFEFERRPGRGPLAGNVSLSTKIWDAGSAEYAKGALHNSCLNAAGNCRLKSIQPRAMM